MNAQAGNQGGSELTALLDASLNEKQWRFQLHDPRTDAVLGFPTSEIVVLKAEELGFDFLQGVSAEGAVSQIRKIEGVWRRDGDLVLLSAIQDEIDQGDIILKPLYGNGGAGVFRLDENDRNLSCFTSCSPASLASR